MRFNFVTLIIIGLVSCQSSKNKPLENQKPIADKVKIDTILASTKTVDVSNPDVWKINSFVGEFGEPTTEKFVKTKRFGTFSNSATSNEYLMVEMLLTKKNAAILLHEYNDNKSPQKFIGAGKIRLKNEQGKDLTVFSYSSWNQEGGLLIDNDNFRKLRDFMLNSTGTIKVVVYDDYSSVYNFQIDMTAFETHFEELKVSKKK